MISTMKQFETFSKSLQYYHIDSERKQIDTLQLNIRKKYNQDYNCYNESSDPNRILEMSLITMERIMELLTRTPQIKTVEIIGEEPELNPDFKSFIKRLKDSGVNIIFRLDLSVIIEKDWDNTAQFLADNKVMLIVSLPDCILEENGFEKIDLSHKSVSVLLRLNQLGYGFSESGLTLDLLFHPSGPSLPGDRKNIESEYKTKLMEEYGISFNHLYTISNMPINKFAYALMDNGDFTNYCNLLYSAFNSETAKSLKCSHQLAINWNGEIFDCEFNQALNIPVYTDKNTIWDIENLNEVTKEITYARHCYGCTAVSSCITDEN